MLYTDVLVIGLGAMGSASVYQLASRGARVIGIDRFTPPHTHGSSHGETRITRLATGEGDAFVPLARRSHALWRSLEAQTGESLYTRTGGLFLSSGLEQASLNDFAARTTAVARRSDVTHAELSRTQLEARYPQFQLEGEAQALFDPEAGMLYPERCIQTQLELARRHGAQLRTNERVLEVKPVLGGVQVRTDQNAYHAAQVVLTAGGWNAELLSEKLLGHVYRPLMRTYRQVLYWFRPRNAESFTPENFPVFIWAHGSRPQDHFYGFPALTPEGGVKLATEQVLTHSHPDALDRKVSALEVQTMFEDHIRTRLPDLEPRALKTQTCFYTVTPDSHFIVDRHPRDERVVLVSACSGHGFKHSAALGEAVAQLTLEGQSDLDLSSFGLRRFASGVSDGLERSI